MLSFNTMYYPLYKLIYLYSLPKRRNIKFKWLSISGIYLSWPNPMFCHISWSNSLMIHFRVYFLEFTSIKEQNLAII